MSHMGSQGMQPFPNNQRLAVSPSEKLEAMELGRKLKEFLFKELEAKEGDTHIKIVMAALQYVASSVDGLDGALIQHNKVMEKVRTYQEELIENGVLAMRQKCTEAGLIDKIYEPYSESVAQLQEEEEMKKRDEAARLAAEEMAKASENVANNSSDNSNPQA